MGIYELKILMRQFQYFGPFPAKYEEIADEETVAVILYLMDQIPQLKLTHFHRTTEREVSKKDKVFICKIMKMDPRDRPSAKAVTGCVVQGRRGASGGGGQGVGCHFLSDDRRYEQL